MDDQERLQRSRLPAIAAFLLAITALLMPWWGVSYDDGTTVDRTSVHAFHAIPGLTTAWGPLLSGILAAIAVLVLLVRLAAHSQKHEPDRWRRDLWVATGLLATAALVCFLWPSGVPSFWGGRTYSLENSTSPAVVETAMPMIGWWLCLLAGALTALAARMSRPTTDK